MYSLILKEKGAIFHFYSHSHLDAEPKDVVVNCGASEHEMCDETTAVLCKSLERRFLTEAHVLPKPGFCYLLMNKDYPHVTRTLVTNLKTTALKLKGVISAFLGSLSGQLFGVGVVLHEPRVPRLRTEDVYSALILSPLAI